ncbi:MAG: carbamoyltransferase [Desulfobulbaceae bacterium]|nr:carbamoyltransferase [Desulfobulbaceae bacterium]
MNILGISAFYHDAAAALVADGEIVAAAQEERFSRKKHDESFPLSAIRYCLAAGGVSSGQKLDAVIFYDKPITKFARLMETYFSVAPRGLRSFLLATPQWIKRKLWIPLHIEDGLDQLGVTARATLFAEHHESHAAGAFYPSPFPRAAVLVMDGVGEWATTSIGVGEENRLTLAHELRFPHSLGLLYSAFTYFAGFKINSGEYKLMGLAPYGQPRFVQTIYEHLLDLKDDGSFRLNMAYFDYLSGLKMTGRKFAGLFGGPPRQPESAITEREMDIAASIQVVTEEIVLRMARQAKKITGMDKLCLSGGVALNCVANGRLLREHIFDDIYIQPASGDAGGALGAALLAWHQVYNQPRQADGERDRMKGAYLGPEFTDQDITAWLEAKGYPGKKLADDQWAGALAALLAEEKVVGLFQGRMEFGPRALGNRSIIGDARSPTMQSVMNLKIKYRESFRPFAPSCLEERGGEYFDIDRPSPYMLIVADVRENRRLKANDEAATADFSAMINQIRSDIPAVTHVDYSARIQTVSPESNRRYYNLIKEFDRLTGCGVIINTSFNVRGEPIVCTPEDAYRCFMRTGMDYLALGSFLLKKEEQPPFADDANWRQHYQLD